MPIQYLYPNGDKITTGWTRYINIGTFFSKVDEGVISYDDADYIKIPLVLGGTNTDSIQLNIDDFTVIPSSILFRARVNQDTGFSISRLNEIVIYNSSNERIASGGYINTSFGGFSTVTQYLTLTHTNTHLDNPYITINAYHDTTNLGLKISAFDLLISGDISIIDSDLSLLCNGSYYIDSGICLYTNGGTYEDSGLELHTHGHTGINSLISMYTKGGTYEDSGISLYIDAFDDSASGLSLFTKGSIHLDSGINLYASGSQQPFNNTTLYTATIGEQSSGTDLYTQGAYYQDSGLNLHIQRCTKEARLQPLYDNEINPNPVESGYEGYLSSDSSNYNGIDGRIRWGFYSSLGRFGYDPGVTDKLHFSLDSFDGDNYLFRNRYTEPYTQELISTTMQGNYIFLNGQTDYTPMSNAGATFYPYESGRLELECNYLSVLLANETQGNGYAYHNDISMLPGDSGLLFDFYNSLYMWFKVLESGNNFDFTTLFHIMNKYENLNYVNLELHNNNNRLDLILNNDNGNHTLATGLSLGWHFIGFNTDRQNTTDVTFYGYLDGQFIGTDSLYLDNSLWSHFGDGKKLYIGENSLTSNNGDISFLCDSFKYAAGYIDMPLLYDDSVRRTGVLTNYFEHIGCSGTTYYECKKDVNLIWGDDDYIHSENPLTFSLDNYNYNNAYVYFYDGYKVSRSTLETHNVVDFQSRGIELIYPPTDTYLRFRADMDTPFKVTNIYIYDQDDNILAQKITTTQLDGYGTCGPYEILLDTTYFNTGEFIPTRTRISAEFYVDSGCLGLVYATGLITFSASGSSPFATRFCNHRIEEHYNGVSSTYYVEANEGINGLSFAQSYSSGIGTEHVYTRTSNVFGYTFPSISDITSDKYLGLKISYNNDYACSGAIPDFTCYTYRDFTNNLGTSSTSSIRMGRYQPSPMDLSSGNLTLWTQLPDNLSGVSGVQVGFEFSKSYSTHIPNTFGVVYEGWSIELECVPFIYIDTTNKGVARLGNVKLSQLDVVFEVPCSPTGINDGITLYTAGHLADNSGLTLYTSGGIHESLPLYTSGMYFARSGLDMYIRGAAHSELPLYIKGFGGTETSTSTLYIVSELSGIDYGSISNTLTLFTKSIPLASGDGLNLYIAGPDSGIIRDFGIEMFVEGYGGSQYAGIDLFLNARDSGVQYGYGFNSSDLYIPSTPNNSGDMTLYIAAPESGYMNESLALVVNNTDAWASKSSGMNMYLRALESGNTNTTLFIQTNEHYDYSGDMSLYMFGTGVFTNTLDMELYISGKSQPDNELDLFLCVASNQNEHFSLYTKGWGDSGIKTATLHTKGFGGREFERTDLFILGPDPSKESGDMTLFIEGGGTDDRNRSTDLYTVGTVTGGYLNSIPMYTAGGFDIGEMPLYLENLQEISLLADSGTLYVCGFDDTSIEGIESKSTNLFINGASSSNNVSLTIINSGIYGATNNISLSMAGRDIIYDSVNNGCDLTIGNYFNLLSGGLELFMYSQQHYNDSGELNLYMSRSVESSAMRAEMYVSGPVGENNSVNMYINGGTDSYESVTLCLPSSVGSQIRNINMYSHGF